jgi:hypothetical protein
MKAPRIVRRPLPAIAPELPGHPVLRRIAARGVTMRRRSIHRLPECCRRTWAFDTRRCL